MATVAELADQTRDALIEVFGSGKVVDADKAYGAWVGLFIDEAQNNGYDPANYSIPEELRDYVGDRLKRLMDDAWNTWDQAGQPQY